MRTFGQLLTEYMARTGISDSELARTLGVRRQTIFRWKEGLVEKPRYRVDVLRCATRLRLTSEERDQLLLAAGFAPEETVGAQLSDQSMAIDGVQADSVDGGARKQGISPAVNAAKRIVFSLWGLAAALVVIILVVTGIALNLPPIMENRSYPVAGQGEVLVIVGSMGVSSTPSTNGRGTAIDASLRLKAALEREIRAARMDRVNVVIWPEKITDVASSEEVARQSNAKVVIGGSCEINEAALVLHLVIPGPKADDLSLDRLLSVPSRATMTIDVASQDEIQTLARLVLGHLHILNGNLDLARTALIQAEETPIADKKAQAVVDSYLGYVYQTSAPPDLDQAFLLFGRALDLSEVSEARLDRAVAAIRQNRTSDWQNDLSLAAVSRPTDGLVQQAMCWGYALDGQADQARPHCDVAKNSQSDGFALEASALVYAEQGRFEDASKDMSKFVDWLQTQPDSLRNRLGSGPAQWLAKLKGGENPFGATELASLRNE